MMHDYLISMFIDDELDLDDKIEFVETVHEDRNFKEETVGFLRQEKMIRSDVVDRLPHINVKLKESSGFSIWRPLGIFASGLATALIIFYILAQPSEAPLSMSSVTKWPRSTRLATAVLRSNASIVPATCPPARSTALYAN